MIYKYPISIPFQDIDAAGVVFFAHLFRYAHESYEALMSEIKLPLASLLNEGEIIVPLVHAEADYHQALHYAEQLSLELVVENIGESHFSLCYRCMKTAATTCAATIKTVHVVCDAKTKNKVAIPAKLRSGLECYQSESAVAKD